jgi:hypothetical protein
VGNRVYLEENGDDKFLKKLLKNTCEIKKKLYFCSRFEKHAKCCNETRNKIRHVPRHIELTAVLKEISKQKNKE